tara:strand:+ start:1775 stop:2440 length:666 start_codon:yes stop_codon:yes gene_type:complete
MKEEIYLKKFLEKIDNDIYDEPKSQLHYSVIKPQTNKVIEKYNLRTSNKILDMGCGDGYFLSLLQEKGFTNLVGVTKTDKDIERCKEKGLNDIRKIDMTFSGIKEEFDFLWCRHVLEHSPYPYLTLHEFNRLVKFESGAYIEVPAAINEAKHEDNRNHYSLLTKRNWIALMLRSGFDVDNIEEIKLDIKNPNYKDGEAYPETWWGFYLRKTVELNFMKGIL